MFHVPIEIKKKVLEDHNTNEENAKKDVEIVRNWIKTQPHLPEVMGDNLILAFIGLNKCSIENTKKKIDNYYTIRSQIPEFYDRGNPKLPNMKKFIELSYCFPHPKPIDSFHRVWWLGLKSETVLMLPELVMWLVNIAEIRMNEDFLVDDVWIVDMKNVSFGELASKATPTIGLKMLAIYEKVFSLRVKAAYFLNSPPYITIIMNIMKILLKPKLYSRIHVCQSDDILKQLFSTEDLPKDYGGEGPSMDELNEMMIQKMAEYQDRFDELDKLRVNEKLRPEKLCNDEFLGFHGNFKQLCLD